MKREKKHDRISRLVSCTAQIWYFDQCWSETRWTKCVSRKRRRHKLRDYVFILLAQNREYFRHDIPHLINLDCRRFNDIKIVGRRGQPHNLRHVYVFPNGNHHDLNTRPPEAKSLYCCPIWVTKLRVHENHCRSLVRQVVQVEGRMKVLVACFPKQKVKGRAVRVWVQLSFEVRLRPLMGQFNVVMKQCGLFHSLTHDANAKVTVESL